MDPKGLGSKNFFSQTTSHFVLELESFFFLHGFWPFFQLMRRYLFSIKWRRLGGSFFWRFPSLSCGHLVTYIHIYIYSIHMYISIHIVIRMRISQVPTNRQSALTQNVPHFPKCRTPRLFCSSSERVSRSKIRMREGQCTKLTVKESLTQCKLPEL